MLGSEKPGQREAVWGSECSAAAGMAQPRAQPADPWATGDNEGP